VSVCGREKCECEREGGVGGTGKYAPVDGIYSDGLRGLVHSMVSVDPAGRPTLQQVRSAGPAVAWPTGAVLVARNGRAGGRRAERGLSVTLSWEPGPGVGRVRARRPALHRRRAGCVLLSAFARQPHACIAACLYR
jgi:hypothetical protein